MTHKYWQKLPKEVETRLDDYIERVKKIKWFQPNAEISKEIIEKQVDIVLKAFWVEASIEYKQLKTPEDWSADLDATWGDAWGDALGDARDAVREAAWGATWGAAWDAVREVAWGAAWGAACDADWVATYETVREAAWGIYDELLKYNKQYSDKYPNGSFINLIPLYEMGLYPIGVVDWKFVIAIPASKMEFPEIK